MIRAVDLRGGSGWRRGARGVLGGVLRVLGDACVGRTLEGAGAGRAIGGTASCVPRSAPRGRPSCRAATCAERVCAVTQPPGRTAARRAPRRAHQPRRRAARGRRLPQPTPGSTPPAPRAPTNSARYPAAGGSTSAPSTTPQPRPTTVRVISSRTLWPGWSLTSPSTPDPASSPAPAAPRPSWPAPAWRRPTGRPRTTGQLPNHVLARYANPRLTVDALLPPPPTTRSTSCSTSPPAPTTPGSSPASRPHHPPPAGSPGRYSSRTGPTATCSSQR